VIKRCKEVPSPRSGSVSFDHAWKNPGTYTVTLTVSTYDCATYDLEQRTLTVEVIVPSPSPTPTTSSPTDTTPPSGVG
jgi:PKD repeat protein